LWIRVDGPNRGCVIQQNYGSDMDNAWQLCVDVDGGLQFYSVEAGVPDLLAHTGPDAPPAMWTHVALVHTMTSKVLYRNGVELVREDSGPAGFTANAATYIGADVDTGSHVTDPFEGAVDEARIYARALTPSEVGELAAGNP